LKLNFQFLQSFSISSTHFVSHLLQSKPLLHHLQITTLVLLPPSLLVSVFFLFLM